MADLRNDLWTKASRAVGGADDWLQQQLQPAGPAATLPFMQGPRPQRGDVGEMFQRLGAPPLGVLQPRPLFGNGQMQEADMNGGDATLLRSLLGR